MTDPLAQIRVGIADDHAIVRGGLKEYVSQHPDMKVVGEAESGRAAIDLVRTTEMDVLLLDLSMPGQSGIDAIAMIHAKAPGVGILVLSGYPEEHYALPLIRQGASGYLNKECELAEIGRAIRAVGSGRRYYSSGVSQLLADSFDAKHDTQAHERLSAREFQVFLKLARGDASVGIADSLSLSVKTVSTYRTRVMEKLSLSSNSHLTHYALMHKLID